MKKRLRILACSVFALLMQSVEADELTLFAFDHHVTVLNDSTSRVRLGAGSFGSNGGNANFGVYLDQIPPGIDTIGEQQGCFLVGECDFDFLDGDTPRTQTFQFVFNSGIGSNRQQSLPGTVFIEIVESIDGPLAYRQDIITIQNQSIRFTPQGIDPDGQPLAFTITANPDNGSLRSAGFLGESLIYEPNTDFVGVDTFLLAASNGTQDSPSVEFTVTVRDERAPLITSISPSIGTNAHVSEIVIQGRNFVADGTSVRVNGIEALDTQSRLAEDGSVEVVATVAPQALGRAPVSVTTDVGSSTHLRGFEFEEAVTGLVSAVLPLARSVTINTPATAFATVINAGNFALSDCSFSTPPGLDGKFHFQTTDPQTNAVTGTEDAAVTLGALEAQSYVFSVLSSESIAQMEIPLIYSCDDGIGVGIIDGINVFRLAVDENPVADVIAVAGVAGIRGDTGTVFLLGDNRIEFFVVATSNIGAAADITVTATTSNDALPITVQACIDSADCPAATNSLQELQTANSTAAYFFLVTAQGDVPFDPAANRINVNFTDSTGVLRGSTSVAVTTEIPD